MNTQSKPLPVALLAVLVLGACSDPDDGGPPDEPACEDSNRVGETCVGVPTEPVCRDSTCTQGVDCTEVVEVGGDAALADAMQTARTGACLALVPGSYGDGGSVTVPAGVSLLGRSALDVDVRGLVLEGGTTIVRGLRVGTEGVRILEGADARIEATEIVGPSDDAFTVGRGARVTIVSSTIRGAGGIGIRAIDTGDVRVERSIVQNSAGPGIWVECSDGCACASPATVSMDFASVRHNGAVGIALVGVSADIRNTSASENSTGLVSSGGIAALRCSDVHLEAVTLKSNAGFGMLVDGSAAILGGADASVAIGYNRIGLWVQDSEDTGAAGVELIGGHVFENDGVGIGVLGASSHLIVRDALISATHRTALPVLDVTGVAAVEEVGDGIDWLGGARVTLERVVMRDDERAAILIDGPVDPASSITGLVLETTDLEHGVTQQSLGVGDALSATGVPITTYADRQIAIPTGLGPPAPP